jgi:uncharacterized protein (TIGR02145 family)
MGKQKGTEVFMNKMKNKLTKLALAAALGLALAFTFGCSDDKDDGGNNGGGGNSSPSYGGSSSSGGSSSGGGDAQGGCPNAAVGNNTVSCGDQTYRTVNINGQRWMAENLNYNASGSVCYDNLESNCNLYGRLYNWSTATDICPNGWHLPSDAEWTTLTDFVGSAAGTKLKANSSLWSTNTGTDDYGFAALPGGHSNPDGSFGNGSRNGGWWSATESNANYAYNRFMSYSNENVNKDNNIKTTLGSVRCLQD